MSGLRRTVLAFLLLKLGVLTLNLARFPVLRHDRPSSRPGSPPPGRVARVSLLVPVRNEAARIAEHLPTLLDQDADEVIVLDDESDDDTREQVLALLAGRDHARLVAGSPAPAGWVGKGWACEQLAREATGSMLVFCDSDVGLASGALRSVLAQMTAQGADVFSVFPRQVTRSLGEHLIAPLVDDAVLCLLPFPLLAADVPSAATANGSVLAFTRDAYSRLGGFAAVRGELVEDVAIARRARRDGLRLGLALGGDQVQTRMYDGYGASVRGFARGLVPVVGSRPLLVLALAWHLLAYTLPWPLALRHRAWAWCALLGVAERLLVETKTGRNQLWQGVLTPLCPLAAAPVVARALRRRQTWKDRTYP